MADPATLQTASTRIALSASSQRVFKRYATTQGRQSWTCTGCGHHVHPTAGTIFDKSSTSLRLWFHAIYLMTSTRCGISAKQLERELGVYYKTAWRMFNKIRNELMNDDAKPLNGKVEIDETGVHGRPRGPRMTKKEAALSRERQVSVLGMVERGGRVKLRVIKSRRGAPLSRAVRANVNPNSIIFTDDWASYKPLGREYVGHSIINHSAGLYVHGDIHTNTIEGFFGNLKTGMRGIYKKVSRNGSSPTWTSTPGATTSASPRPALDVPHVAQRGGEVTEQDTAIGRIKGAARKREKADTAKREATDELRRYCREAQGAGVSITRIASEAGLSRQGVYDLLAEPPSS